MDEVPLPGVGNGAGPDQDMATVTHDEAVGDLELGPVMRQGEEATCGSVGGSEGDGWTATEVARDSGKTKNSPTPAVFASSKAWMNVEGAPGRGWDSPARSSASPVEVGVPLAVMVVTSHTSLLPWASTLPCV